LHVLELAKRGAIVRLHELRDEIDTLVTQFPHLRGEFGGSYPVPEQAVKVRARKRHMSAAARKAASVRMKKYWASRRKSKHKQ
jgi:hypothetical protein